MNLLRFNQFAKEAVWIVIGQIASVLGSLVLVRILTEYLDSTQFGQLALGLTVAGLVNQVVMGGITAGVGRFYSIAVEKQDIQGYLRAAWQMMGFATLAVAGFGFIIISGLLWLGYSEWIGLTASALLFSILSGYSSTLSSIQNAARQRMVVAFHSGLDAWLKILLTFGLLLWLGSSSKVVVIGYCLSTLLVAGSQLLFLRRSTSQEKGLMNGESWMRQMWSFSRPFSIFGGFTWLQQSSDRWALETFGATQDVGLYAVLFQLGYTPVAQITGMVMTFLSPILYQRSGDATNKSRNANVHNLAWRITGISLIVTLIGCLMAFGLHSWLFRLLVASEYQNVSYLLPWVVLAGGLFASGQMLALKLMSDMKSGAMTCAKITTAILGTIFNLYGASMAGIHGVVGGLVAFSAIYFAWMVSMTFHNSAEVTK